MRADVLFAELASDFGGELVVGGGPFREPPTVMQSTVCKQSLSVDGDAVLELADRLPRNDLCSLISVL